ncbi:uncharacterized protein ColSpa_06838 [Colletotrichum spaethianum]|uniref:Glucose-methanol-choline oxidoreductase N-terminal domain-containing protein n=1 Tax=Colletotrichum spaethianum TaxID=700344 RepID=A0AA37NYW4_9PEZI|nr:uncharacterized protein ColSpa_06838 [Colletotrichum spaethianum]GKT46657.1 hypothetical protein ColSpa_06838 [Colletotrichum spaethianum]
MTAVLEAQTTPPILIVEDRKVLPLVLAAATAMVKSFIGKVVSTPFYVNNDSPDRDNGETSYQFSLLMKDNSFISLAPRDFIFDIVPPTNDNGSSKYELDVALNTLVTKINFEETNGKPKTPEFKYIVGKSIYHVNPRTTKEGGGVPGRVFASKEVLISAGTSNTPQFLKLSGVGPASENFNRSISL